MSVKVLRAADKDMLRALARAGTCTQSHFSAFGNGKGLSGNRMLAHIKAGFVDKDIYYNKQTQRYEDCYTLTRKGVNLVKEQLGIERIYTSNSRVHDLALMDKYISLNQEEQETWRTESQIREEAYNRFNWSQKAELEKHHLSPPDAVYRATDGRVIAFEVVTNNYGAAEIKAKEEFATAMDLQLQIHKI